MNRLERLVLDRLQAAGGWLAFDDFMSMVLYEPGLGYYSRGGQVLGHFPSDRSDFVTAPEMSPIFGAVLARQVAQALRATGTHTVLEFGAGSGALAGQILDALNHEMGVLLKYKIVEISSALRARQHARLARFGDQVEWLDSLPDDIEAVMLGNEVLDALPVKLLHWDGNQWFERGVVGFDSSGEARFSWSDRSTHLRPPFDHDQWVPGTVTEIHPHAKAWVKTIGERLRRGAIFLVDYGFGDSEYYHPQRLGGTLMCHRLHRSDADPLGLIGEKDITAHVNFTSIALAAQDVGLQVLGYTSQARFLINCGIAEFLESADMPSRNLALRLVNEHEMGELFKVIGFCDANHSFDAIGFGIGDRTHRL